MKNTARLFYSGTYVLTKLEFKLAKADRRKPIFLERLALGDSAFRPIACGGLSMVIKRQTMLPRILRKTSSISKGLTMNQPENAVKSDAKLDPEWMRSRS